MFFFGFPDLSKLEIDSWGKIKMLRQTWCHLEKNIEKWQHGFFLVSVFIAHVQFGGTYLTEAWWVKKRWRFEHLTLSCYHEFDSQDAQTQKKPRPLVPELKIKAGLTKRWHWHTDNASDSAVSGVSLHSLSRCKFEHKEPEEERQRLKSGVLQRYKLRLKSLKIETETGCVSLVVVVVCFRIFVENLECSIDTAFHGLCKILEKHSGGKFRCQKVSRGTTVDSSTRVSTIPSICSHAMHWKSQCVVKSSILGDGERRQSVCFVLNDGFLKWGGTPNHPF